MIGLHIACTGRLGGDPEQRYTGGGKAMLVVTRRFWLVPPWQRSDDADARTRLPAGGHGRRGFCIGRIGLDHADPRDARLFQKIGRSTAHHSAADHGDVNLRLVHCVYSVGANIA